MSPERVTYDHVKARIESVMGRLEKASQGHLESARQVADQLQPAPVAEPAPADAEG